MLLADILRQIAAVHGTGRSLPRPVAGLDIRHVTMDSRQVGPGDLFAAVPGATTDGRQYIAAAVANGNVRVVRGMWLTDWLDELSAFPEVAPHDDQVDSVVGAFNHVAGLGSPARKRASLIV